MLRSISAVHLVDIQLIGEHQNGILRGMAGGRCTGTGEVGVAGILQIDLVGVAGLADYGGVEQLGGVLHDDLTVGSDARNRFQIVKGNGQAAAASGSSRIGGHSVTGGQLRVNRAIAHI